MFHVLISFFKKGEKIHMCLIFTYSKKEESVMTYVSISIDKECILSYGENCQHPCSVHCINQTCDRFNGSCQNGCSDGGTCQPGLCMNINKSCVYMQCDVHLRVS